MRNLETFDWLVIVVLAALLISKLVKGVQTKPTDKSKSVVDEKSDIVQVSDTRDDEKRTKAD